MRDHWESIMEDNEYTIQDAASDAYFERLEKFWYEIREINKDWEELSFWEIEELKRAFIRHQEQMERWTDPEMYFGVSR